MEGGRIRDPEGINYPFETIKLDPSKIDFDKLLERDGQNIYVLAHQPGIGKTYSVMQYLKKKIEEDEDFTFFYFTDRHKTIDEYLSGILSDYNISHWKGFGKYCKKDLSKTLFEKYHAHIDMICNLFDETKDDYENQFENVNRVFFFFYYLDNNHFTDNMHQIAFLDERVSNILEYSVSRDRVTKVFRSIGLPHDYISAIENRDYNYFFDEEGKIDSKKIKKIKKNYYGSLFSVLQQSNKKKSIQKEIDEKFGDFTPDDFEKFLEYGNIYGFSDDLYGFPLYYYAFDVALEGIPIVIMDATFNERLFHYFLESYNGEMKKLGDGFEGFSDLNVEIFTSDKKNEDSIIDRMRPTGGWPASSFGGHADNSPMPENVRTWLLRDMRRIMDIFGRGNVGIITFKKYAEVCQTFGFDVEYFGALRGTNLLADKKVLVIIGGWFPPPSSWEADKIRDNSDYLDTLVKKYFLIDVSKDDIKEVEIGAPEEVECSHKYQIAKVRFTTDKKWADGKTPADECAKHPVSMINTLFYDEMYQAFHRNRGLRYPRIIFAYAWFPEPGAVYHKLEEERVEHFIEYNLRDEFGNIEKVPNDEVEEFFNRLEKNYSSGKVESIIREFEKGEGRGKAPSNTEIANKYKIWKGSGRGTDNKIIEEFRKIYKDVKEKAKKK